MRLEKRHTGCSVYEFGKQNDCLWILLEGAVTETRPIFNPSTEKPGSSADLDLDEIHTQAVGEDYY